MMLVLSAFLLISVTRILGQGFPPESENPRSGPNEDCLRCICHARSGCFQLRNCANYSISREYWTRAGKPTMRDDKDTDPEAYINCIQDDNCIMRAIRGYLLTRPDQDCNCDGVVDCKDYAAIHLNGDLCRNNFDQTQLRRLDTCLQQRGYSITQGWSSCPDPRLRG